jgi:hypothetical protein
LHEAASDAGDTNTDTAIRGNWKHHPFVKLEPKRD